MLDVHLLQRRDDRRAQGMTCHQFISVWIFLSRVQASCSAFLDAAMLQRSVKRSGHRPPSGMIEEMDRNASGGIVRDSSRPECVGRGSSTESGLLGWHIRLFESPFPHAPRAAAERFPVGRPV
jgi:hypothetical protein